MVLRSYNPQSPVFARRAFWLCFVLSSQPLLATEGKVATDLFEFKSLSVLTHDLNRIAQKSDVPFQIKLKKEPAKPNPPAGILFSAPKISPAKDPLSELSINQSQEKKTGLDGLGSPPVIGEVEKAKVPETSGALRTSLPIPLARVVEPTQPKWSSKEVTNTPVVSKNPEDKDVISGFAPKATRFGEERYDGSFYGFQNPPANKDNLNQPADPESVQPTNSPQGLSLNPSDDVNLGENPDKSKPLLPTNEEDQKDKKKEAMEKLQEGIKEFAERDEEKQAFTLADYYDLRGLFSTHSGLLNSMASEELDERFLKNAKSLFNRFGERDNSPAKKSFENFLRRLEPRPQVFQSNVVSPAPTLAPKTRLRDSSRHLK